MLQIISRLLIFLFITITWAQNGFEFKAKSKKITIPFKLVNNLVIVPVDVNGAKLNFLLDTGVSETLLFSLDETDQVKFENIEKVKFAGYGNKEPFDGLKSSANFLKIGNFIDTNHTIYIVLDQEINISSQIGVPVNGVIGSHFFKNYPVEIKYKKNKIIIHKDLSGYSKTIAQKYKQVPISIEGGKPYLLTKVSFDDNPNPLDAKLLIDTGNSDALWLFKNTNSAITVPKTHYDDFLGKGFSGNIYGKRGRLESFEIGLFKFKKPLVSFPDSTATQAFQLVDDRVGSVGSEIMRRFNAIYDYKNGKLYLNKNHNFIVPFNFNMSGMDVQHDGLHWVTETYEENSTGSQVTFDNSGNKITRNLKYKFQLKPSYSVLSVVKGSPADLAGIKEGDAILRINGNYTQNSTLQDIKDILKSEDGRVISLEVERKGKIIKTKLQLKSIL